FHTLLKGAPYACGRKRSGSIPIPELVNGGGDNAWNILAWGCQAAGNEAEAEGTTPIPRPQQAPGAPPTKGALPGGLASTPGICPQGWPES
ncbi:hypothetical protein P7K49_020633, partial [Saguinus oedipus]